MRSFKRVGSLPAGKAPTASLAFSPDGALLAAATTHGTAQLFSTHSREPVAAWQVCLPHHMHCASCKGLTHHPTHPASPEPRLISPD